METDREWDVNKLKLFVLYDCSLNTRNGRKHAGNEFSENKIKLGEEISFLFEFLFCNILSYIIKSLDVCKLLEDFLSFTIYLILILLHFLFKHIKCAVTVSLWVNAL